MRYFILHPYNNYVIFFSILILHSEAFIAKELREKYQILLCNQCNFITFRHKLPCKKSSHQHDFFTLLLISERFIVKKAIQISNFHYPPYKTVYFITQFIHQKNILVNLHICKLHWIVYFFAQPIFIFTVYCSKFFISFNLTN